MKKVLIPIICLILTSCSMGLSERVPCPKVAILAEFQKSVDLQQKEPIRFEIDSLTPVCTKDGKNKIVDIHMRVTAIRPLKNYHHKQKYERSYFVAVMGKDGNILSQSNHIVEIEFDEKQTTKVTFQDVIETVPDGKDVTIYVGFKHEIAEHTYILNERSKKIK